MRRGTSYTPWWAKAVIVGVAAGQGAVWSVLPLPIVATCLVAAVGGIAVGHAADRLLGWTLL